MLLSQNKPKENWHANILSTEIKKIKERYPYFELEIKQDTFHKPLLFKQPKC